MNPTMSCVVLIQLLVSAMSTDIYAPAKLQNDARAEMNARDKMLYL